MAGPLYEVLTRESGAAMTAYRTKAATVGADVVALADGFEWDEGDVDAAEQAVVTAHTNPICVTWDGTEPQATVGMYVAAGATVVIRGRENVQRVQMVRQGGADAVASVTLECWGGLGAAAGSGGTGVEPAPHPQVKDTPRV